MIQQSHSWYIYPTLGHISREKHSSKRHTHLSVHCNAKTWEQPKCPLKDEWIKKMLYTYTIEYYSVIKKNEMLSAAV